MKLLQVGVRLFGVGEGTLRNGLCPERENWKKTLAGGKKS